jgi:hypothetical protein
MHDHIHNSNLSGDQIRRAVVALYAQHARECHNLSSILSKNISRAPSLLCVCVHARLMPTRDAFYAEESAH